jgi:superfamily II DNA/RNA helicase
MAGQVVAKAAKDMTAAELYRQAQQISTINDAELPDPMEDFATTPFSKQIKEAFVKAGYTTPSPIQVSACARIHA